MVSILRMIAPHFVPEKLKHFVRSFIERYEAVVRRCFVERCSQKFGTIHWKTYLTESLL